MGTRVIRTQTGYSNGSQIAGRRGRVALPMPVGSDAEANIEAFLMFGEDDLAEQF